MGEGKVHVRFFPKQLTSNSKRHSFRVTTTAKTKTWNGLTDVFPHEDGLGIPLLPIFVPHVVIVLHYSNRLISSPRIPILIGDLGV
jgi:hypothetical protein